jgi:hypothetical protein
LQCLWEGSSSFCMAAALASSMGFCLGNCFTSQSSVESFFHLGCRPSWLSENLHFCSLVESSPTIY